MRTTVKALVFAFLLLLGFGAQSALPCVADGAGAHNVRAVASDSAPTAANFDRVLREQHCDCPARAELAQAVVTAPEKVALVASFDGSAASPDASFAELRRTLDAYGKSLSGAAPAPHLPPYLLTARLRC